MPARPAFMLRHALLSAGFVADKITIRAFRQGAVPVVAELDRPFQNDETIYVEATT
jgi:hypothetical protein